MKKIEALGAILCTAASVGLTAAPSAQAAGSCSSYRPTLQYAYAQCSGILDTGYIAVTADVCSAQGCTFRIGPKVSKAGGSRSEIRVGTGYSLTNVGYRIYSN